MAEKFPHQSEHEQIPEVNPPLPAFKDRIIAIFISSKRSSPDKPKPRKRRSPPKRSVITKPLEVDSTMHVIDPEIPGNLENLRLNLEESEPGLR